MTTHTATPLERVPVLDLSSWHDGDHERRREIAREACAICREIGFMYVSGHRIPQPVVQAAFAAAARFFALDERRKRALVSDQTGFHKGYVPMRAEVADAATASADVKEAFDLGTELSDLDPETFLGRRLAAPNLWPDALPGFREAVEAYYAAVDDLAALVMRVFAVGLELPETYFDEPGSALTQMRLIHYPPQRASVDSGDEMGIGAHRDFEALTILAQDDVGGLQVRNLDGGWLEAPPVPGAFVVNIGEMLARWTNGTFTATEHRVINRTGRERYSIPFFWAPPPATSIEPVPGTEDTGTWRHGDAVSVGEYFERRLREVYG